MRDGTAPRYPSFLCGQRSHFAQSLRDAQGLPDRQLLSEQAKEKAGGGEASDAKRQKRAGE